MKTKNKVRGFIIRGAAYAVLLSCAIIGFTSAFNLPSRWSAFSGKVVTPATQTRTLTFADRVASQRAIEEIYWRHRIWPKERPDAKLPFALSPLGVSPEGPPDPLSAGLPASERFVCTTEVIPMQINFGDFRELRPRNLGKE